MPDQQTFPSFPEGVSQISNKGLIGFKTVRAVAVSGKRANSQN